MTVGDRRDTVLFVAVPAPLGGSNRALAALLGGIDTRVRRVLASPAAGDFLAFANDKGLIEAHLPLPHGSRLRRIAAAARIAWWVFRHRPRLLAIHANASRGLNLSVAAGFLTGVPITVWVHDPVASPWGKRLGPLLKLFLRRVRWFAVSDTARRVVVGNGLCRSEDVEIVPNPVDPATVLGHGRTAADQLVIGYLGAGRDRKGFDLLPDIIEGLADMPLEWRLFTKRVDSPYATPIWNRLDSMTAAGIKNPGPDSDVRRIYDQCDIVLVPSREESFSLVTAEAMLNGIPVVASNLEPLRDLLSSDTDAEAAGLLFPTGDAGSAASAIRRLAEDPALRARMGEEGRRRAIAFRSDRVAARLLESYGYSPS